MRSVTQSSVQDGARPRIGLFGNPSDLYGGKVVAFTFDDFEATARIEPLVEGIEIAGSGPALVFPCWSELVRGLEPRGGVAGAELLAAAMFRMLLHVPELKDLEDGDPRAAFRIGFETDVPRQAGLSGSSAIVIAALRALMRWFKVESAPFEISELALAAETEDLGLVAGPQDRVVQAFGGLVAMDFTGPRSPASYEHLDPALLPPLLCVWGDEPGTPSGDVHKDLRARWLRGDTNVRGVMARFSSLVDRGLQALRDRDLPGLADAVDANFDLRSSIFPIADEDRRLIELGREHGAAVKFPGSGGAALAVPRDPATIDRVEDVYREAGLHTLRPRVSR